MGAIDFYSTATGDDLESAFQAARHEAAWEHGHRPYSGSAYEKERVTLLDEPRRPVGEAMERAKELLDADDPRVRSKWGPAGALAITTEGGEEGWLFFGVASC
ncbi:hypothetical protein AB0G73_14205 [Streptomyces sp. NPDC020719]|uniref:hypothetical protein n=1 Tax=Streptomyces sp. NPDC020719 TaxID=3154896 RepID=UPI00340A9199